MSEEKRREEEQTAQRQNADEAAKPGTSAVSETWAEETIASLDEFIEEQGIYIRQ